MDPDHYSDTNHHTDSLGHQNTHAKCNADSYAPRFVNSDANPEFVSNTQPFIHADRHTHADTDTDSHRFSHNDAQQNSNVDQNPISHANSNGTGATAIGHLGRRLEESSRQ